MGNQARFLLHLAPAAVTLALVDRAIGYTTPLGLVSVGVACATSAAIDAHLRWRAIDSPRIVRLFGFVRGTHFVMMPVWLTLGGLALVCWGAAAR